VKRLWIVLLIWVVMSWGMAGVSRADDQLVMPPDLLDSMSAEDAYWLAVEVNSAAAEYDVPVRLCWELIRAESSFHHINPATGEVIRNSCNAIGICQIIPDGMAIKKKYDIRDRRENIRCMAELMAFALHERGYSVERALGWYNTGQSCENDYARLVARRYRRWAKQDGVKSI